MNTPVTGNGNTTNHEFELTPEQVDFFHREGYLSLPALTTAEDVAALRVSYDRIFAMQAGREDGNQFDLGGTDEDGKPAAFPQILNPALYAPEMNDSMLLANARRLVKQLFGAAAQCSIAHAIFKPAHTGAATPWHQDAAYWDPSLDYPAQVSIWVPLQEAKIENGCMWFVPGSHASGEIHRHQSIRNDPRIHGLELHESEMSRTQKAVACPLLAGGCTVHGGYMLHYTGPNISDIPRRALILMGGLPAVKRPEPRRYPWLDEKKTARMERAVTAGPSDIRAIGDKS